MSFKMDAVKIRKVQNQILKGLIEIKRICEKHNLRFYLVGGSALGAIRHEGFIPWDDDADIGMPRDDYNKFLRICNSELHSDFFLQTSASDTGYYLPYAKLRIENTKYVLQSSRKFKMHQGIFIDIFPLDSISNHYVKRMRQKYVVDFLTKVRNTKIFNPNKGTIKYYLRKMVSSIFTIKQINYIINHEIRIAETEDAKYMGNLLGLYGFDKEVYLKEIFGEPYYAEFEGEYFPIPQEFKVFLGQVYGDYMKLPPIEKRNSHNAILLEIDNINEEEDS